MQPPRTQAPKPFGAHFPFRPPCGGKRLVFLALWGALVYNKKACYTLCAQARRPAVSRVRRAHDITKGSFPVPLMRLYFSSKFKKNLFPVLTISITFGFVLYFLLSNGGAQNLGQILLRLRWEWLGLAVFAVVLTSRASPFISSAATSAPGGP